jgi:hypothetical protein
VRSLLRLTGMLTCVSVLTACASLPQPETAPPIQASLLQPCRRPAAPSDGTRAVAIRWALDMTLALRECADRHAELARAVAPAAPQ